MIKNLSQKMKNLKKYRTLIIIILAHQLWAAFIQNALYPIHFAPHNLFILELIDKQLNIPSAILFLLDAGNIILLWLIGRRIFVNHYFLVPSLIYSISPWSSYIAVVGSFYIYLSFLLLLTLYGLLLIKSDQKLWGTILASGAAIIASYSSIFLSILMPLFFILIAFFGVIPFNKIKRVSIFLIILLLPLLFFIYSNRQSFNSILKSEITIFSDPGLLNMVNNYQGAANRQGFGQQAKLSENRYLFFSEYVLLKFTKQFVPSTYFTQQEKLLNFSFSSPIYVGFLIPFLFGLYLLSKSPFLLRSILISTLLVIPSILSKQMVDLNRLLLFSPVIILVISYGLIKLYEQRKRASFFLVLTLVLVIFQLLVTISDIQVREKDRFIKYFGQNYEIGKQ